MTTCVAHKLDLMVVYEQLAVAFCPQFGHPFSEVDLQEAVSLVIPINAESLQLLVDHGLVHHQFQELEENALAGGLWTDEYREVPELDLSIDDRPDVMCLYAVHGSV